MSLTIALIVPNEPDAYTKSREILYAAFDRRGVHVENIRLDELGMSTHPRLPPLCRRAEQVHVDAVMWASLGGPFVTAPAHVEAAGIPCVNSSEAIATTSNKGMTNALSKGLDLPIPRTVQVAGTACALTWAEKLGYPVIFKRLDGERGAYVERAFDPTQARAQLQKLGADRYDILVSDYEDCGDRTRRLMAIGGIAIPYGVEATIIPGQSRDGTTRRKIEATDDERRMIERFAKFTQHGCLATDSGIVRTERPGKTGLPAGSIALFEGNSLGGLSGFIETTGYNVAYALVDFLVAKALHWQRGLRGNPPGWRPPGLDMALRR